MRKVSPLALVLITLVVSLTAIGTVGCTHKTIIETPSDKNFKDQGLNPKLDYGGNTETTIGVYDPEVEVAKAKLQAEAEVAKAQIQETQKESAIARILSGNWCLMFCEQKNDATAASKPDCDNSCNQRHPGHSVSRPAAAKPAPLPQQQIIQSVIVNPSAAPTAATLASQPVADNNPPVVQPALPIDEVTNQPYTPTANPNIVVENGQDICLTTGMGCPGAGLPYDSAEFNFDFSMLQEGQYSPRGTRCGHHRDHMPREPRQPRQPTRPQPVNGGPTKTPGQPGGGGTGSSPAPVGPAPGPGQPGRYTQPARGMTSMAMSHSMVTRSNNFSAARSGGFSGGRMMSFGGGRMSGGGHGGGGRR